MPDPAGVAPRRPSPPLRPARIAPLDALVARRADGVTYVRSPRPMPAWPRTLVERLEHWAAVAPGRDFLAERDAAGAWRRLTYGHARTRARAVAQALLDRGLGAGRPVAILSGNGIAHGVLALGTMYAGVPCAPLSPAYALQSRDHATLRRLLGELRPGLVFAADGDAFAPAIAAAVPPGAEVVTVEGGPAGATAYDALLATAPTPGVDAALARSGPDTLAKILFTSGSTGRPRGVLTTQRMLCANQAQLAAVLAFLADAPPVLCDWLPWNHVFGGSHNFGIALHNGGTLYVDEGRPTPDGIAATVRNLRDVAPTAYFNVPRGYELLVPHLRDDAALRERFFSRVAILFTAAAGLGQGTADALEALSARACGARVRLVTGWGATESAPFALCAAGEEARAGAVGLPAPGVELKLVPAGGKLEARLRGPNVTPGLWRDDDATQRAFDEEGFYRTGDALAWVAPGDPSRGLRFDGRLHEDFKLATGTWVSVDAVRARALAALGGLARDVVLAGEDRPAVGALVFPDVAACRALAGGLPDEPAALVRQPVVRDAFARALGRLARECPGSSTHVAWALLLDAPPSLDAGELTDKGAISQRAVLRARAPLVDELFDDASARRIAASPGGEAVPALSPGGGPARAPSTAVP